MPPLSGLNCYPLPGLAAAGKLSVTPAAARPLPHTPMCWLFPSFEDGRECRGGRPNRSTSLEATIEFASAAARPLSRTPVLAFLSTWGWPRTVRGDTFGHSGMIAQPSRLANRAWRRSRRTLVSTPTTVKPPPAHAVVLVFYL